MNLSEDRLSLWPEADRGPIPYDAGIGDPPCKHPHPEATMFGARVRKIPLLVVSAAGLCAVDAAAQSYACVLTTDGDVWTGACTSPDGEPLRMEVRAGESADIEWVGGLYVNDMGPLAFEIAPSTSEARGVIRTPFGWLWLDGFSAGDVAMEFGFDIQNEVPPGPEDVLILRVRHELESLLRACCGHDRRDGRGPAPSARPAGGPAGRRRGRGGSDRRSPADELQQPPGHDLR